MFSAVPDTQCILAIIVNFHNEMFCFSAFVEHGYLTCELEETMAIVVDCYDNQMRDSVGKCFVNSSGLGVKCDRPQDHTAAKRWCPPGKTTPTPNTHTHTNTTTARKHLGGLIPSGIPVPWLFQWPFMENSQAF